MGVVFAQYIAHGAGRLLVLGRLSESQLTHGVYDAPLYWLQTIANMGQGAIQNDVHGIVEVGTLGIVLNRLAFNAVIGIAGKRHVSLAKHRASNVVDNRDERDCD